MDHLSSRLASDYTLFNLNDPETTRFYVNNMDYFITNFAYFKDIKALSSYFLSQNKRFNTKFQTRITKFIDIIDYDAEAAGMQPPAHLEEVRETFTSSDDEIDIVKFEKFRIDDEEDIESQTESQRSSSLISLKSTPLFPNHFPEGPEFTVNPTGVVLTFYSKILIAFAGKFVVTPQFVSKMVKKATYGEIGNLLCTLVKQSGTLDILISCGSLKQLCHTCLPVLEDILDSSLYFEITEQSSEDKLLDAVFEMKDHLMSQFLKERSVSAYNILLVLCSNKGPVNISEVEINEITKESLLYIRLLSFNTSFTPGILSSLTIHYFGNPNCSHLLFSVTRILIRLSPEALTAAGFFDLLKESIFRYAALYSTGNTVDSLFAFLIKIYAKHRQYLLGLPNSDGWDAAHALLSFFMSQEKFNYRAQDLNLCDEMPPFRRYIVDCFLSDIPYSTVFKGENG